jgi:hypothetical protein
MVLPTGDQPWLRRTSTAEFSRPNSTSLLPTTAQTREARLLFETLQDSEPSEMTNKAA